MDQDCATALMSFKLQLCLYLWDLDLSSVSSYQIKNTLLKKKRENNSTVEILRLNASQTLACLVVEPSISRLPGIHRSVQAQQLHNAAGINVVSNRTDGALHVAIITITP